MTIPGVDILGSKAGYSSTKPWLFEDFDQITFYRVTEEEYEKELALFNSGRYEYQYENVLFDMAEHNKLLQYTRDEVSSIRTLQRSAQAEMDKLEDELLKKWHEEKKGREVPMDEIEVLLKGKYSHHPYNIRLRIISSLLISKPPGRSTNPQRRVAPKCQRLESPS